MISAGERMVWQPEVRVRSRLASTVRYLPVCTRYATDDSGQRWPKLFETWPGEFEVTSAIV